MKKILKTSLIIAAATACTVTAIAASSELASYPITIHDQTTPAAYAAGKSWPISTWYFYSEDGQVLGSISEQTRADISKQHPIGSIEWDSWLANEFNEYRQIVDVSQEQTEKEVTAEAIPSLHSPTKYDAEALALEVASLTNVKREEHGLPSLEVDNDLMELAMVRAKEVSTKYSHERPDGSHVTELGCGENVGAKATPKKQVESWMNSDGHRRNMLKDWYKSTGVGCYKAENGNTYWVQIFKP